MTTYQAVILAAGRGSRLGDAPGDTPKPLMTIGSRSSTDPTKTSFLRRQVELLQTLGVDDVVVVVGHKKDRVTKEIAAFAPWVKTVVNPTPDIGTSGSLHSFQFAARSELGVLDGEKQTVLFDADIVYHRDILVAFLASPPVTSLLVSGRVEHDDEEVLVYGSPLSPRFIGKGLSGALVADATCLGEAMGIVKFAPADHKLVREIMDWLLGDPDAPEGSGKFRGFGAARRATEHEELSQRLMHMDRLRCVVMPSGAPFMEVDRPDEYRTLQRTFYPNLLREEASGKRLVISPATSQPMILLNPGPANTTKTVKHAMIKADICPREQEFGDVLLRVRDQVTRVVHGGNDFSTVLFGGSGTAATEAAVCSAVPKDGRLLVIDNGAYGARMADIARAYQMSVDVEKFGVGGYPDLDRISDRLTKTRYTHMAVVHHETSTGMLNPVAEIGALCREHDVSLIVDAMSSYGGLVIDMETLGADYLISSANKCIQGMAGLGFVICRTQLLDSIESVAGRGLYLDLGKQHRYLRDHGQMRYTPPVQVVYALEQALIEFFNEGAGARQQRYFENFGVLDDNMRELGFRRLLPESMLSRILTAYIEPDHDNYSFSRLHDDLYTRGFTIYPGKGAAQETFRLANMGATYPSDMVAFAHAMQQTVADMKLDPLYRS